MRLPMLALVIALVSGWSAYAADEDTEKKENLAHGYWMTDKKRSKVRVGPCTEKSGLCTEIVWLRDPNNSRGVPLTDGRNQNVKLRKRPIMGLKILEGLKQIGRYEWEGKVYNPEDGKTYKANLALVKPDMLRLKGCMPMGWPCRSKFWTRTEFEPPAPPVEVAEEVVVEETVEAVAPSAGPAAPGATAQPRPQPVAPAPADIQTASRQAPVALAPQAQAAPTPPAAPKPAPAPQQQAAVEPQPALQPAPAARRPDIRPVAPPPPAVAPEPAPVAPAAKAAPPPPPPAYQPKDRVVAAPPPPPPPPIVQAQPQRQAAVRPPPPVAPTAREVAPSPPPAVAPQASQPESYGEVAAVPTEPVIRRGGDGSNYLVQVAARQNREEALAVFNDLRRRYPRMLGNTQPIIKRVNLGELGVWYRVRVGPISGKAAALSFCNRLKFAGSDCFIRRQ